MLLVKKRMGFRDTAIDIKAHFVIRKKFGMALFRVQVRNTEEKNRFLTIGQILLFLSFFLSFWFSFSRGGGMFLHLLFLSRTGHWWQCIEIFVQNKTHLFNNYF